MFLVSRRVLSGAALAVIAVAAPGCTRIVGHQGYLVDDQLISTVRPGVDNRDSVQRVLGRPSFTGQFTDRDWYYVGLQTRQLAFGKPQPVSQTVLHVKFDPAGNVAGVERTGLERVASINPTKDETPTLGRERGFFQDLFGNIGRVGTPGPGGGANPSDNTGGP